MRTIDLTGPEGNAFALMGLAKSFSKQLGKTNGDAIVMKMMAAESYDDLLAIFSKEFCEGAMAVAKLYGEED